MTKIQLCDQLTCTQCMACVNACPKECIKMVDAGQGFAIPQIDESLCVQCGMCMRSCHQLENTLEYKVPIKTLACWTKVVADRKKSSSGGAFSVLAKKVLKAGGVVYGVKMDKNFQVFHTFIERVEDLRPFQGSKYVQSYLGNTFSLVKKHLREGRLVLFTGTPCQVGGLLTFLHKKYENLITCDMICHGVPSQKAFDMFCERTCLWGTCDRISFRFTEGWGYQLAREFDISKKSKDNNIQRKPISPRKAWFMRAFNKSLMFNEACYACSYARPERVSDFTMADYWGLGVTEAFKYPTYQGVSMLLVNTYRAYELLQDTPDLFFEERKFQEALNGNYNLSHSSVRPNNRDEFIADLFDLSNKDIVEKYGLKAGLKDYLRLLKQYINSKR